jgi:hypothetical protein
MWSTDRVVQTMSAAAALTCGFSTNLINRLAHLLADYHACNEWLSVYFGSDNDKDYDLFRVYWFQQRMLQKEMDELCDRFVQWNGQEPFNLYPQAEDVDTQYTMALLERYYAKPR